MVKQKHHSHEQPRNPAGQWWKGGGGPQDGPAQGPARPPPPQGPPAQPGPSQGPQGGGKPYRFPS